MERKILIDIRKDILKKSQAEVAEILGISRTFYNQIENGTRNPKLYLALKISKIFGIPVEKIFISDAPSNHVATGTDGNLV
ncbi:MAG: helix-turn-helix domain-containing protein [Firmicutes bacterium]|nr:helix-turn-helix domain-containing protein [Bacillota bacterium]